MILNNFEVKQDRSVFTIVINREKKLNALDDYSLVEFYSIFEKLNSNAEAKVIILTGKGKAFCAGSDIEEMVGAEPEYFRKHSLLGHKIINQIRNSEKILIASINGYALGGGLEIALACDLRFACEDAKLGLPEIKLNVSGGWGSAFTLPRLIGLSRAKELLFTGKIIDADYALNIGLLQEVMPMDQLNNKVMNNAQEIAKSSSRSLTLLKFLSNRGIEMDLYSHSWIESMSNAFCSTVEGFHDGIKKYKK